MRIIGPREMCVTVPVMVESYNAYNRGTALAPRWRLAVISGIDTANYDDSSRFIDKRTFKVMGTTSVVVPVRGVGMVEKTCFVLKPCGD